MRASFSFTANTCFYINISVARNRFSGNASINIHSFFRKIAFIFGHDVVKIGGMEIECYVIKGIAKLREGTEGKLKQPGIVSFLPDFPAVFKYGIVYPEKVGMSETAFGMLVAGPWIRKIEIYSVYFIGSKYFLQQSRIGINEKQVFNSCRHGFFGGQKQHILISFNGDKHDVGVFFGAFYYKIAFPAAYFKVQLSFMSPKLPPAAFVLLWVADNDIRAFFKPGDKVFLSSHSHNISPLPFFIKYYNVPEPCKSRVCLTKG